MSVRIGVGDVPICATCGKKVYLMEQFHAFKKTYHKDTCFKCGECGYKLTLNSAQDYHGDPICKNCYQKFKENAFVFFKDQNPSIQFENINEPKTHKEGQKVEGSEKKLNVENAFIAAQKEHEEEEKRIKKQLQHMQQQQKEEERRHQEAKHDDEDVITLHLPKAIKKINIVQNGRNYTVDLA